jgi:hypothetical protein
VRADPEPKDAVGSFHAERAVSAADPDGPEASDALEVQ